MIEINPLADAGPKLSSETVDRLESQLGARLPHDYRRFLLESNGGIPEKAYFSYMKGSKLTDLWVDFFLVIDKRLAAPDSAPPTDTLAFWNFHFAAVMPPKAMLIGSVSRDHKLLLYLQGPRTGEVYLVDWDDVDETTGHPTRDDVEKAIRPIAPSFGVFFSSLYNAPRYPEPHR